MDIHSVSVVLSLVSVLQVLALYVQYRLDNTHSGLGWWTAGTAMLALGFAANFLRDAPVIGQIAVVANNALFVSGLVLIYTGVLRFLGKRERRLQINVLCGVFTAAIVYFTYQVDDQAVRRVLISFAIALLSILIARALKRYVIRSITITTSLLAIVFLLTSVFFVIRAAVTLAGEPADGLFSPSLVQITTYMVILAASTLWTYGIIIMVNQRSNAESREAREKSELIFKTSPDAVAISNLASGRYVDVNDGFTKLIGYTHAEAVGKTSLELRIFKNLADREPIVATLRQFGFFENMEVVLQRKDGSPFIGTTSSRILDLQGVAHIVSVTRDVTAAKEAEKALQRSELRYRSMVEWSPNAIVIHRHGLINYVNRAAITLLGAPSAQAVLGTPFLDRVHPDSRPFALARWNGIMVNGVSVPMMEQKLLKVDGTSIDVEVQSTSFVFDGEPSLHTAITDITERKQAEVVLRQTALDLQQAYNAIIESLSRALDQRDHDTEGHTLRVANVFERLARAYGVSGVELVHMQRGALLHDIGKVGIPDSILLKAGPLTDMEWVVMRQHPQMAYDLLAPISYLHPALDIPYCHHERWDGTGYPRGLSGEAIPLAARLFTVVDVWDAMRTKRTYHPARPDAEVEQYLRDQSGKLFDPSAVELFIKIDRE